MADVHDRATRLMRLLVALPASRFTLGEILFIATRFRYQPEFPDPVGVGNLSENDMAWLESIAKRLLAEHPPDVH